MNDLRNLPEPLRNRLTGLGVNLAEHNPGFDLTLRSGLYEARRYNTAELRRDDDDNPIFDGYATVYDVPYPVWGGPERGGWDETIVAGAADKSVRERDDVRLLVNHDSNTAFGVALARTKSRTLELDSDKVGLRTSAPLDPANPVVLSLVSAMERGDIDEMSFAFRAIRQEWNDDYTDRRIVELGLVDVAAVTYPANPAALAQLRTDNPEEPERMTLSDARAIMERIG